jgi:hypothetical protein
MVWQTEVAHQMALVPLVALGVLRARGERRDAALWWIALAFAVSWLADLAADLLPVEYRWAPSVVYPVTQAAIIGAVLLPRLMAVVFLWLMYTVAAMVVAVHGIGPDRFERTAVCLGVVAMVWYRRELPSRLRIALAVYFGVGLVAWLIHVQWLVVATWYPYQLARLAGLLLFAWAALEPRPSFKVVRRTLSPLTVRI